jgi:hypothetical protein
LPFSKAEAIAGLGLLAAALLATGLFRVLSTVAAIVPFGAPEPARGVLT